MQVCRTRVVLAAILVIASSSLARGQCHVGEIQNVNINPNPSCPGATYFQQNAQFRAKVSCLNNAWKTETTTWEPQ